MATPTFDPTDSPFLPSDAPDGEDLAVYAVIAEDQLGLHGASLPGDDAELARHYVAKQVAWLVRYGLEVRGLKSLKRGQRTYTYNAAAAAGVDPVAESGAAALLAKAGIKPASQFAILKSTR